VRRLAVAQAYGQDDGRIAAGHSVPQERNKREDMMNVRLCDAAFAVLAGMMVPAAEAQLLTADKNLVRLTPSLGSGGE
jgi:predicted nucleic acid-binding protein